MRSILFSLFFFFQLLRVQATLPVLVPASGAGLHNFPFQLFGSIERRGNDSTIDQPTGKAVIAKYATAVSTKTNRLNQKIARSNTNILKQISAHQANLAAVLKKSDSIANSDLLQLLDVQRAEAIDIIKNPLPGHRNYIAYLDSTLGVLSVLGSGKGTDGHQTPIHSAIEKTNRLQEQLNASAVLLNHLKQSSDQLTKRVSTVRLPKSMIRMKKSVLQYNQRIDEYAKLLKNKKNVEKKVMQAVANTKPFKQFMHRNSMLASMFRMPSEEDEQGAEKVEGLQSRSAVEMAMQDRLGALPKASKSNIGEPLAGGRATLGELKARLLFRNAGNEGDPIPQQNQQKGGTTSMGKRLIIDINVQPHRSTVMVMDIGMGIGYKWSERSIIGIGTAYKVGLGKNIQNLSISHQGISLRSFVDWRIKNGIWISGGYERNYLSEIRKLYFLRELNAWQQSGLIGVTKTIQNASGLLKSTKFQLFWDFLSNRQVPRAQPLVFRMGYSFR